MNGTGLFHGYLLVCKSIAKIRVRMSLEIRIVDIFKVLPCWTKGLLFTVLAKIRSVGVSKVLRE